MAQISKAKRSARLRWARARQAALTAAGQANKSVTQSSPAAQPRRRRPRPQAPVPGPGVYLGTRSRAGAPAAPDNVGVFAPPLPSPSPPPPATPAASPSPSSSPSPPPFARWWASHPPGLYSPAPEFRRAARDAIKQEPLEVKMEDVAVKLEDMKEEDLKQEVIKDEPVHEDDQADEEQNDGVCWVGDGRGSRSIGRHTCCFEAVAMTCDDRPGTNTLLIRRIPTHTRTNGAREVLPHARQLVTAPHGSRCLGQEDVSLAPFVRVHVLPRREDSSNDQVRQLPLGAITSISQQPPGGHERHAAPPPNDMQQSKP
ncbi:hypothetical protein DFH29DRAFT_881693 [Suillus ampliporus]|nr:hypothetical protein DFH29DRAFT_881693 [Suillus ampliporus]